MGGIPTAPPPKPTDAEIIARLIEIGRNAKVPDPHTVWVVEDPRSLAHEMRDICYTLPVGHLETFPFGRFHLESSHIVFFHSKYGEEAKAEAIRRLKEFGYLP